MRTTLASLKKRAKIEALQQHMCPSERDVAVELSVDAILDNLPQADRSLARVHAIDILEHVQEPDRLLAEIYRVLRPGGTLVVTVPRHERHLDLNRLRRSMGLAPSVYGHVREGYSCRELAGMLRDAGFVIVSMRTFCGLFTETIEMVLNRLYLCASGESISPHTGGGSTLRRAALLAYSMTYPFLRAIAALDKFAFPSQRYGIAVKAVKGRTPAYF